MTAPPQATAASQTTATSASGRQIWRTARGPVLVGLALLLIAVVSVAVRGGAPAGHLEPDAVNDGGSRALATLLKQRGVAIKSVSTVDQARRAAGPGRLLLVARSEALTSRQLAALARLPGDRLLIAPRPAALLALAPGVARTSDSPVRTRPAGCDLRAARLAGPATTGGAGYRLKGASAQRCYPASGSPSLIRYERDARTVTIMGTGAPFTNALLDQQGNAALSMNLVGSSPSVVWLVPDPIAGAPSDAASPLDLLPPAVPIAAAQLAIAVVLVALWRARRLGPVVSEPLPVVVRAAETVEGRARLYRSRRARRRAAAALRASCRTRLTHRLGLGPEVSPQALVMAVAAQTGDSDENVGAVLYGAVPEDDAALVRLADDLDGLESGVTGRQRH